MLTDDDLISLLCRGFARATADLDPEADLVHVVRRRYASARRRRLAVGVAVPAAALAAGAGLALAGKHTPGHSAVGIPESSASTTTVSVPRTTPGTSVPIKPASYRVVLNHHSSPLDCPANATAPVGKAVNPAGVPGVWFFTNGQCVFVGVGGADTKPGDATLLHINGYPGLYSTLENGVRTIYAPGIGHRGWWVLKMPATAPEDMAVRLIVVPAD